MKKIKQRFIGLLVVFAVLAMSIAVDVPTAKAKIISVKPVTPFASEIHYTFDDIPNRTVYCNGDTSIIKFYVDNNYYDITDSSLDIISWACCDDYGTLWLQEGTDLYWTNYELEEKNMTPHFFNSNIILLSNSNCAYGYTFSPYDPNAEEILLPNYDDLKNYLENGVPVPGSKPKPAVEPEPSADPDVPSTPQVTPPAQIPKIKKVTTSKNTIKLINSNNEVVDKATFNKKKSTLSYNKKKITKVKGVWFTKRGSLVYLKTNSKAYYLKGKKSKLIKSKVASIKTSKKFATALKLKNGKIYKLK